MWFYKPFHQRMSDKRQQTRTVAGKLQTVTSIGRDATVQVKNRPKQIEVPCRPDEKALRVGHCSDLMKTKDNCLINRRNCGNLAIR
ncbi:hypothetical protein DPMN_178045 [Dreissena polymorpha]|uniref:Uncharacterized protein n=2 Tax=Dreissena polymorpha TaxID=45954 RepID=A0A9D4EA44_DREPO|nr:hypothetical protein DPMN_178031 [Dreissena polymorpha]KAH3776607.1 hypothetical protein DPMN_178038 [Dreissena polymorpha]KAH3776614.1 hypothetical protein DPMN_178045 [Dreissena polymorpha]